MAVLTAHLPEIGMIKVDNTWMQIERTWQEAGLGCWGSRPRRSPHFLYHSFSRAPGTSSGARGRRGHLGVFTVRRRAGCAEGEPHTLNFPSCTRQSQRLLRLRGTLRTDFQTSSHTPRALFRQFSGLPKVLQASRHSDVSTSVFIAAPFVVKS